MGILPEPLETAWLSISLRWRSGAVRGLCGPCAAAGKENHSEARKLWKELEGAPLFFRFAAVGLRRGCWQARRTYQVKYCTISTIYSQHITRHLKSSLNKVFIPRQSPKITINGSPADAGPEILPIF